MACWRYEAFKPHEKTDKEHQHEVSISHYYMRLSVKSIETKIQMLGEGEAG